MDNIFSEHPNYAFSQNQDLAFLTYIAKDEVNMLTKRSTPVDQNMESESMDSKLSVAIFVASEPIWGLRNVLYTKKSRKYTEPMKRGTSG